VTRSVSEAAAHGDRSENAEYIYGKKQLREIDSRVRYLSKRLDSLTIVRDRPPDNGRVYFGLWFDIEDEEGAVTRFRIVGPDEIDPGAGWISVDSPLARAALGKAVDEEFTVASPSGEATYVILAVYREVPDRGP